MLKSASHGSESCEVDLSSTVFRKLHSIIRARTSELSAMLTDSWVLDIDVCVCVCFVGGRAADDYSLWKRGQPLWHCRGLFSWEVSLTFDLKQNSG